MSHAHSTDKPQNREQSHELAAEPPHMEQTPENWYKQPKATTQHIRTASASRGRTTTKSKNVNALSNVLNNTMKNKTTQGPPTPRATQRNRSASINRNTGKPKYNTPPKDVNNSIPINTPNAGTNQEHPRTAQ
ncbi:hypothetical protein DPMN_096121 [Dreissena polymorpha]|uniref:Uncharacterized protein n=1 Tax=Dreissena polymorpha TaxID=45954 RepID=A0A9D4R4G2_DREPO|nr:hypothetical protein DPMN_096121 [Dreissena polymorpha]